VSELRHDVLGGRARVEEDEDAVAAGIACRDGLAGVFAVRAPVVCAVGGVARAVRAAEVRVAVLASGAGAWGEGGGVNLKDPHVALGYEHACAGVPRETGWTDPELQRRYDFGRSVATFVKGHHPMTFEELDRLMTEMGYNR